MKRFWCKKCKPRIYMTRKDLRKHLREEHLIKSDLRTFEAKNRKQIQSWWGEEEYE